MLVRICKYCCIRLWIFPIDNHGGKKCRPVAARVCASYTHYYYYYVARYLCAFVCFISCKCCCLFFIRPVKSISHFGEMYGLTAWQRTRMNIIVWHASARMWSHSKHISGSFLVHCGVLCCVFPSAKMNIELDSISPRVCCAWTVCVCACVCVHRICAHRLTIVRCGHGRRGAANPTKQPTSQTESNLAEPNIAPCVTVWCVNGTKWWT